MPQVDNVRLIRDGNKTIAECISGNERSTFHCDGLQWNGNMPNCSGQTELPPTLPANKGKDHVVKGKSMG